MLRAHGPLINEAVSGLVQRLGLLRTAGAVHMNNALAGLTMEVIGGAAFGWVLLHYGHKPMAMLHPSHLLHCHYCLVCLHQWPTIPGFVFPTGAVFRLGLDVFA